MEKFIPGDIKNRAQNNGTWLTGINNVIPIFLVLATALTLGGIVVSNYCLPGCNLF